MNGTERYEMSIGLKNHNMCRYSVFRNKPGRAAPSAAPCEETNGWKDESCFCEDSSGMVNRDSVVRVNRETFVVVNRDL